MKRKFGICLLAVAMTFLLPGTHGVVKAEDFSGNEAYYQNLCTKPSNDPSVSATCSAFRAYLSSKSSDLRDQVANMNANVESLKNNIESLQVTINEQQGKIDELNAMIDANNAAIEQIQASILGLEEEISQTQQDIDQRDSQIKERMVSEQASIGTNVYVEFMMGAKDLVDLVRIADGIERITENDQEEIAALKEDQEKLNQQKEEQERLKSDEETAKQENEDNKRVIEEQQSMQQALIDEYQRQEADLLEQIRSANAAISAISSKIIAVDNVNYTASDGWIRPVQGGYVSAGTWHYSGGGIHLGEDFATSIGTSIVAPIGGVIVYANNPVSTNSGYLGNYSGHPSGAGNSVHMVGNVNGTTYGVSFFHMSQENFAAYAGMSVSQGTYIGSVGNSGNTSGPHCHVEIINLGSMSVSEAIALFRSNGADFAWGTGWNSTATSCSVKGATPCRERPEDYFG